MKKLASLLLSIMIIVAIMPLSAIPSMAAENEVVIESISATIDKKYVENIHGSWIVDENSNEKYFKYWIDYSDFNYTIVYNGGKIVTGPAGNISYPLFGENVFPLKIYSNQSYENQWGIGKHTVKLSLLGAECEVEVEIIKNPIESISATIKRPLYEDMDKTSEVFGTHNYFKYGYQDLLEYKVVYDGGQNFVGNVYALQSKFGEWVSISDDQTYENQWGIGKHSAEIEFLGAEYVVELELIECPIESIAAERKPIVKNTGGSYTGDPEYFYYDLYNMTPGYMTFTVNYKNGDSFVGDSSELYQKLGISPSITTDQSYENQWDVGTHNFNISIGKLNGIGTVEIIDDPYNITSISARATRKIYEFTECYKGEVHYTEYHFERVLEYTVHYGDNEVITGEEWVIYNKFGFYPSYATNQSYENQWGVGTHTVKVRFMGAECTTEVEIIENPFESIVAVANRDLIENHDGQWLNYNNSDKFFYYSYDLRDSFNYTVTYDGGKVFSGTRWEVAEKFGYDSIQVHTDESYENQWGLGKHQVEINFFNIKCNAEIEVVKSPIESITATSTKDLIENWSGYLTSDNGQDYYYRYNPEIIYTVTYDGGKTYSGTSHQLYEKFGGIPNDYNSQSYENQWTLGENSYKFTFMGVEGECKVNVIKNPIESITGIAKRNLMQDIDCSVWEENGNKYSYYDLYDLFEYTITYDGGKIFKGDRNEVEERFGEYVNIYSEQSLENQFVLGKNTVEIEFIGVKGNATFNIVECDYKAVEISGTNELTITLTKNDNTKITAHVISYTNREGGFGGQYGVLETTAGTFYASFNWKIEETDDEAFAYENEDLQLVMGKLESNKIDCNHLKALLDSYQLYYSIKGYYSSTGKTFSFNDSGYSSIEALSNIACLADGSVWNAEQEWDGDTRYVFLDAQTVEDSIREVFGITVDATTSANYDAQTGKIKLLLPGDFSWSSNDKISFSNGVWTYTQTIDETQSAIIKLNEDLSVRSIVMYDPNSVVIGDLDGDSELSDWDGVLLARYLAGWNVEIPTLDALDIDGDGEITDWDGVVLDRYLAGWNISIG